MKEMHNIELRQMIVGSGLRMKDVAKEMGITPVYLSQMFMSEMRDYQHQRVVKAIQRLNKSNRKSGKRKGGC